MHPKHLFARHHIDPKRSLGQNFLYDDQVLARIAGAAELAPADNVLEIGPGVGALTQHLAAQAGRVVAVELDNRLLPILRQELAACDNVTLVHGDILAQDPAGWFQAQPYKVVANVPYYITGAILRHLLGSWPRPRRLVLTVQREVADRLTARPPEMSLLAVSVQHYGRVRLVSGVRAGAFWPRPEVDSAVARIDVDARHLAARAAEADAAEAAFFRVVRAGFSEKRKQLKNNLRQLGHDDAAIVVALARAGIDGRRRAETLTVAEWASLSELL